MQTYIKKIDKNNWRGVKVREMLDYNYKAFWNNLTTFRTDLGDVKELPCDYSEFYDVSLGTICDACCDFCYVSAKKDGEAYKNPSETWKKWMATYKETLTKDGILLTERLLQIAIGSEGEPCATPYLCDFLKTVYETNVVPNYTTNGIVLSHWNKLESKYYAKANEILDATKKYVGGVAVSYGNKSLRKYADNAIDGLLAKGDCHVMIHHIISDNKSVDEFVECWKKYGNKIRNHVLLPLMASGRSKKGIEDGTFEYLEDTIEALGIKNVAFGAHFIKSLEKSHKIKTWIYPAETYSKNVLLKENEVVITSSSFNLTPVKVIKL